MRVLCVHPGIDFSVGDVHDGWENAFRQLGCEVITYGMHDALEFYGHAMWDDKHLSVEDQINWASSGLVGRTWDVEPDLVFVTSGFFVPDKIWEIWRRKKQRTALLVTESPYEDDKHVALVERVEPDITLINDPTNLDRYRDGKRRVYYMPHAFDPTRHHPPARSRPTRDFVFVGTGYPSRIDFFQDVDWTGITPTLAGNWRGLEDDSPLHPFLLRGKEECLPNSGTDNQTTASLYQDAKVSANLYRGSRHAEKEANRAELARGWAMGPRELELAATGTFFLREPRGEGDLLLNMLPTFTEPGEFSELLRFYVGNARSRNNAANRARAAVQDRTFVAHAARFLRLLT